MLRGEAVTAFQSVTCQFDQNFIREINSKQMINNIQALRAFAAINVVFLHVIKTASTYGQSTDYLSFLAGWGANGVDIFFVISGFVMLHTQMQKKRHTGAFLKSRILRIVPIYWLITLFVVAVYYAVPGIFRSMELSGTIILSSLLFSSLLVLGEPPIVYVGWTLEWEMLFYFVFGLSLFLRSWVHVFLVVSLVLAGVSLASGDFISLEFLFGMAVAYFYNKGFEIREKTGVLIFVFGMLLLCASLSSELEVDPTNRVIIWGVPSFFIVFGLLFATQISNRFLVYLGDASYSIYLVQILTIPAFYKVSSIVLRPVNGDVLSILCLISSVAAGCLVFSMIEKPMTKKMKRAFS